MISISDILVIDVGGSSIRINILGKSGLLLATKKIPTPNWRNSPEQSTIELQRRLIDLLSHHIIEFGHKYHLNTVGIALGAVVSNEGVIHDASILWHEDDIQYDIKSELEKCLKGFSIYVINDVSAAAWRHKEEGRFVLFTVSTGVGCKVFDNRLPTDKKLVLDPQGLGGEIGHVCVNFHPIEDTNAHIYRCECGNLGDLNAYTSGPATLRFIQNRCQQETARFEQSLLYNLAKKAHTKITCEHIALAAQENDDWVTELLTQSTRPLAMRILQLCADLGLRKAIISGGFANGIGPVYFSILRNNLTILCHFSGFYRHWSQQDLDNMIIPSQDYDHDPLIGVGIMVQSLLNLNRRWEKPKTQNTVSLQTQPIPECGKRQILCKILLAGICSTDLQILSGDRDDEPCVLGHEGIGQVVATGANISSLKVGDIITFNPNNPFDQSDKIGHNREGIFQDYYLFNADLIEKKQIILLPEAKPEYTLLEIFSCVVHSQRRLGDSYQDKTVLIYGGGVTAIMHYLLAKAKGAKKVLMMARSQEKINAAVQRGLLNASNVTPIGDHNRCWLKDRCEKGFTDILICALASNAGSDALPKLVDLVDHGGMLCLFGGFTQAKQVLINAQQSVAVDDIRNRGLSVRYDVGNKAITFIGSRGASYEDYVYAQELIKNGKVQLSPLITHTVPFSSLATVLSELVNQGTLNGKIPLRVIIDNQLTKDRKISSTHEIEELIEI